MVALICCLLTNLLLSPYQQDDAAPKKTKIYLEHADVQSFDQDIDPDRQLLTGNVLFRHDSSFMFCDSAYFYETKSSLEAFGSVRMEQGDTLFVYGNYLYYDGNSKLAILRENVRMENIQSDSSIVTLFTDSLNYNRIENIGYYFDGGMIVDEENELTSLYGQYQPSTKIALFNDSVELKNEKFTLYSDTLEYSTETKIATILGPSTILSDSGTIYSSRGWYNTIENRALLLDHSQLLSDDKLLSGDSIWYNRDSGEGEVFGHLFLQDTTKKIILTGDYGYYNEQTSYAIATERALCMEYSQGDTLYLHADSIEMLTVDSTERIIKAYHGVRIYRHDIQGVCDSMQYMTSDSTLTMYRDPILWNEEYQIFGDTIIVFLKDSSVDHIHIPQFAYAIQELDSSHYNQLTGLDMKAFFEEGSIRRIDVNGNAESIYFPIQEDGVIIGMNKTESSFFSFWIKENQMEKLLLTAATQATLTPLPQLIPEEKKMKNFRWFEYIRPMNKEDVFRKQQRKSDEKPENSENFPTLAPIEEHSF